MPLPTPRNGEPKEEFIDRCMGDDTMNEDFPEPSQRRAVCERQWEDQRDSSMSMKYHHVLGFVSETPWAILAPKLQAIIGFLSLRATADAITLDEARAHFGAAVRSVPAGGRGIAVLPLFGTIVQRGGLLVEASGGISTERFSQAFRQALHDPSIGAIVLDVDSPGGAVPGVPELADEVFRARGTKPIIAVADSLAASAAYWIASQADELVVTPSGEVGSIGVLVAHEDVSAALEQRGVRVTLVTAGKHKGEFSPFAPLSDDDRAAMQARANELYDMFVSAVARGRGVPVHEVRHGFGEGRLVGAREALRLGMVDRVETLQETIQRITARLAGRPRQQVAEAPPAPVSLPPSRTDTMSHTHACITQDVTIDGPELLPEQREESSRRRRLRLLS